MSKSAVVSLYTAGVVDPVHPGPWIGGKMSGSSSGFLEKCRAVVLVR